MPAEVIQLEKENEWHQGNWSENLDEGSCRDRAGINNTFMRQTGLLLLLRKVLKATSQPDQAISECVWGIFSWKTFPV